MTVATSAVAEAEKQRTTKQDPSKVDIWLGRETPRIRKALESASKYFDANDVFTVNTLEAVYAQESSFGMLVGTRGSSKAAGHFQFEQPTAEEYGLSVSKNKDQRFDIDYASSAAARYLKDLDNRFTKRTKVSKAAVFTIPITDAMERQKFVLAAYDGGPRRVASAQQRTAAAGKNPRLWADVATFLQSSDTSPSKVQEMKQYVEQILADQIEFAVKSPANKNLKRKNPRTGIYRCTEGHWVTIDNRPVFICA